MDTLGKNIMIVGCAGSGKSTLARRLGEILDLRVIHIDKMYWQSGWVMRPPEKRQKLIAEAISEDGWVFDGNNTSTYPMRVARAHSLIWLDLPRRRCFPRVLWRIATAYGRTRSNMADGCPERFDREFLEWVWNFDRDSRSKIERLFAETKQSLHQYRFCNQCQIAEFLGRLVERNSTAR